MYSRMTERKLWPIYSEPLLFCFNYTYLFWWVGSNWWVIL